MILAIDPGKNKCGLAVLEQNRQPIEKKVVARSQCPEETYRLIAKYKITRVVIGDSAAGKELEKELSAILMKGEITFIPEKDSSRQARDRYWKENPPLGLWKLIPTSLRVPPSPIDDYAALILGERYLNR